MVLWDDLSFYVKIKLFSYWSIVFLIANLIQLFGALSNIITVFNILDMGETSITSNGGVETLIGLGCMSAWIGLIRYMETSKNYSLLANTIGKAMPTVLKTLISALPLFLGYAFLGLAMFWRSNRFSSTSGCLMTLYSLMQGDMVYDTFHDLGQTNYLAS